MPTNFSNYAHICFLDETILPRWWIWQLRVRLLQSRKYIANILHKAVHFLKENWHIYLGLSLLYFYGWLCMMLWCWTQPTIVIILNYGGYLIVRNAEKEEEKCNIPELQHFLIASSVLITNIIPIECRMFMCRISLLLSSFLWLSLVHLLGLAICIHFLVIIYLWDAYVLTFSRLQVLGSNLFSLINCFLYV